MKSGAQFLVPRTSLSITHAAHPFLGLRRPIYFGFEIRVILLGRLPTKANDPCLLIIIYTIRYLRISALIRTLINKLFAF